VFAALRPGVPSVLRRFRAVAVLKSIATLEAQTRLKELAGGHKARATHAAKLAWERLAARPK
jgi:hypothetical protein